MDVSGLKTASPRRRTAPRGTTLLIAALVIAGVAGGGYLLAQSLLAPAAAPTDEERAQAPCCSCDGVDVASIRPELLFTDAKGTACCPCHPV